MANLKNCIITAHISQEHELDKVEGIPNETNWLSVNPGGLIPGNSGIAGMSYTNDAWMDTDSAPGGMWSGHNQVFGSSGKRCPGGCSNIILTIEPNNSPENLEGKDYQYVVAASSFRIGNSIKGISSQYSVSNHALSLNPDYSSQNDVDYVIAYGADGEIDVKRTQTGICFTHLCSRTRYLTEDAIQNEGLVPYEDYLQLGTAENGSGIFNVPPPLSYQSGASGTFYNPDNTPSDVDIVSFHDTGIPNTPGNKVIVKVYLHEDFVMPGNNHVINLDINMDAVPYVEPHPNKLKWILTNQIWPNYNSWKLLTGNRTQDSYRYQYYDEAATSGIDFVWASTEQTAISLLGLYTSFYNQQFSISFPEFCAYNESIGYYPENYFTNSENGWFNMNQGDSGIPNSIWVQSFNEFGPTMQGLYNAVDGGADPGSSSDLLYQIVNYREYLGGGYSGGDDSGWTVQGYNDWLTHEFIGRQNPRVIENCTVEHVNGDMGSTTTWQKDIYLNQTISDVVGADEIIEYKITPDEGYTISAFNVCILPKMNLEYTSNGIYELPAETTQDFTYGGYIEVQSSKDHTTFDAEGTSDDDMGWETGHLIWQYLNTSFWDTGDEDVESMFVKKDYNRLHMPLNSISLNKKFYDWVNDPLGSSYELITSGGGEFFINVKWEDGTTLPYGPSDQAGASATTYPIYSSLPDNANTLDKIMFGSSTSLMPLALEQWSAFFDNGEATPQDISEFQPNGYFNKKFESWKFGYPLVFSPFKIVNLGNKPYHDPTYNGYNINWIDTDGNPIEMPYGFTASGGKRDDYPGGANSFGGYNDNSGVQYVEIKNTIPHSFQENPSPDNEVLVRIKIKSDWTPEESTLSSDQIFMLNIWGQARLENEELEFNVGPN